MPNLQRFRRTLLDILGYRENPGYRLPCLPSVVTGASAGSWLNLMYAAQAFTEASIRSLDLVICVRASVFIASGLSPYTS